jgi:hypothetical protein
MIPDGGVDLVTGGGESASGGEADPARRGATGDQHRFHHGWTVAPEECPF